MKSILISIQPKWCEMIANGKKTIEVRKTRPKIETPFKCYIYCTKNQNIHNLLELHTCSGNIVKMNEKVIGEFVCDEIYKYLYAEASTDVGTYCYYEAHIPMECRDCINDDDLMNYGNGLTLYGWHISDLKIYDEPKELK